MALCVEQGPAHQPGCGEVLQAAQLHGQQAHHLALHAGLLHVPVLPQVRTHPGPAFLPLSYALFWSLAPSLQLPRQTLVHVGEWSLHSKGNSALGMLECAVLAPKPL